MAEKLSRGDKDLLAYACWIMGDMSTRDTVWSDREIEAYAMIMERMSTESKSVAVKTVAKHLIQNIDKVRIDESVYEQMKETLEKCRTLLTGINEAAKIRFLYWILEIGRAVSRAQPKGWFSGGGDPESSERGKSIVLLSICPIATVAKFIDEGQFNLPLAIDHWVGEHGA
jgi:hypothetical protein